MWYALCEEKCIVLCHGESVRIHRVSSYLIQHFISYLTFSFLPSKPHSLILVSPSRITIIHKHSHTEKSKHKAIHLKLQILLDRYQQSDRRGSCYSFILLFSSFPKNIVQSDQISIHAHCIHVLTKEVVYQETSIFTPADGIQGAIYLGYVIASTR